MSEEIKETDIQINSENTVNRKSGLKKSLPIIFMLFYFGLYDIFDTYNTSFYPVVVSYVTADLGISIQDYYHALGFASLGMFFVVIVQFLADFLGRKPMIIVTFFGMGLSAYILYLSQGVSQFGWALFTMFLFFSSDTWVLLVSEDAPKEKRGRYTYIPLLMGVIGVLIIPFFRSLLIDPSNPSTWRNMTFFAWLAMPISLLGLFLDESPIFIKEKKANTNLQKWNLENFKEKISELFNLSNAKAITAFIFIGLLIGMNYSSFQTIEDLFSSNISDPDLVSSIIFVAGLGSLIVFLISGFLADKLGRRITMTLYALLLITGIIGLVITTTNLEISGVYLFAVIAQFGFWGTFTLSKLYCVENFETSIRGSASGLRSFAYAGGLSFGSFLSSALLNILTLPQIYILYAVLAGVIIILLTWGLLPETKNLDLEDI